ncbi:MAG: hypothetical protein PHI55_11205 [Burkholderiaceae bacterium]|nr:hypothetical protein [Burkholderiaceae bacterium]
MTHSRFRRPPRRDALRWLLRCGLVGCGMAWGLREFYALQRARYHVWRVR